MALAIKLLVCTHPTLHRLPLFPRCPFAMALFKHHQTLAYAHLRQFGCAYPHTGN